MSKYLFVAFAIIGLISCSAKQETVATSATSATAICGISKRSECKVGEIGPGGGIVFFVDSENEFPDFNFLEAAPTDASAGVPFVLPTLTCGNQLLEDCQRNLLTTAEDSINSTAIGKGELQSVRIVDRQTEGGAFSGYAAVAATQYSTNTADDWFLPSRDELSLMYTNLRIKNLGNFSPVPYWSSSELASDSGTDPSNAYIVDFNIPQAYSYSFKSVQNRVRAIRKF